MTSLGIWVGTLDPGTHQKNSHNPICSNGSVFSPLAAATSCLLVQPGVSSFTGASSAERRSRVPLENWVLHQFLRNHFREFQLVERQTLTICTRPGVKICFCASIT